LGEKDRLVMRKVKNKDPREAGCRCEMLIVVKDFALGVHTYEVSF